MNKSFWDQRYSESFLAYGREPNAFLYAVAAHIPVGLVLVIAAGEGRDAVYLAKKGHDVTAMDQSGVGMEHTHQLATQENTSVKTIVGDLEQFHFEPNYWTAIVSIWLHLPPKLRKQVHQSCVKALQPGGMLILEAYTPEHLHLPGRGGPENVELLVNADTLRSELEGLSFILCQDTHRYVNEGRDHQGLSGTVQILAAKL